MRWLTKSRLVLLSFALGICVNGLIFAQETTGSPDSLPCGIEIVHSGDSDAAGQATDLPSRWFSIRGKIFDCETRKPVPFVTIQVVGTGRSTLSNGDGEYRLVIDGDSAELKFTHIAYYTARAAVSRLNQTSSVDAYMRSSVIEIPGIRVYDKNYSPAEEIIVEAIRRKKDILAKLKQFDCDAYTKLVVRDVGRAVGKDIILITETQVTCQWEQPDKYKEIITARKQSANLKAEENLVSVGQILNFNENRIGPDLVSPTATDALDYYRYYLTDTIEVDSQRVFVLEIEPKNDVDPLFSGTIQIADSTFDVVGVDVGISGRYVSAMVQKPHYSQRCARFDNNIWMPVEIRFSFVFKLMVPLPGVPSEMNIQHAASLYSYSFTKAHKKGTFDEYQLEVSARADKIDSTGWKLAQTIPLTTEERRGYSRIDSVEHAPKSITKQIPTLLLAAVAVASMPNDLFRFNRVEGAYLGFGQYRRNVVPNTDVHARLGYAFGGEYWEGSAEATHRFGEKGRFAVGGSYLDEVVHRPTVVLPRNISMSAPALWDKSDPFDYYRERGFRLWGSSRLLRKTKVVLSYNDFRDRSASVTSTFSFTKRDSIPRENPAIDAGHLRSVSADFFYDSRPLFLNKGWTDTLGALRLTQFAAGVEYASPDIVHNDFHYRRYYASLFTNRRLFGLGTTSLYLYWGTSDWALPPQRYFTMESNPMSILNGKGFQTLNEVNFCGSRIFSITARHQFGHLLFAKSGLPLLKEIPFTAAIHGGAFWCDFDGHPNPPVDSVFRIARSAYSELGFSIGNLTPFIAPFNLEIGFTWQLSAYGTSKFQCSWGLGL